MSSGRAKSNHWVLEYESRDPLAIDPLTGNAISTDTHEQIKMQFDSLEEAVSYAKANKIPHRVHGAKSTARIPRSYADNFAFERKLPWTH